jgi:hypothetical protein
VLFYNSDIQGVLISNRLEQDLDKVLDQKYKTEKFVSIGELHNAISNTMTRNNVKNTITLRESIAQMITMVQAENTLPIWLNNEPSIRIFRTTKNLTYTLKPYTKEFVTIARLHNDNTIGSILPSLITFMDKDHDLCTIDMVTIPLLHTEDIKHIIECLVSSKYRKVFEEVLLGGEANSETLDMISVNLTGILKNVGKMALKTENGGRSKWSKLIGFEFIGDSRRQGLKLIKIENLPCS